MSGLLSFDLGRQLNLPNGTLLIRCDSVMVERPGAGGYAIIVDGMIAGETILKVCGKAETTTDALSEDMVRTIARTIRDNRAVVITRSESTFKLLSTKFSPFKLIRLIGYNSFAVSDATRHAHVSAIKAQYTKRDFIDEHQFSEYVGLLRDRGTAGDALKDAVRKIASNTKIGSNADPELTNLAQELLNAMETVDKLRLQETINKLTARDIPRPVKPTS
ncbi:MAG: hypothetical protein DDT34_02428 [Firmicutes bacterium]|nr:hypothetical protein [Bacillota bacterium]